MNLRMDCNARPIVFRGYINQMRGASIVEAVIALPVLLIVILGAIQFGLIYEAKATLNHASLQAARLGAVQNADPGAIRRGLARGLAPLYAPDSSLTGIARTIGIVEGNLAADARIRILNPTREAFDDFGVDVDGEREIPNDRLHARSTAAGSQSGLNIQDANLLKVQITYGYELQVPLVNWFIARVLLGFASDGDAFEQQQLRRTRLPIMTTATVRMQSAARLSDLVASIDDFPELERIPSDAAPPAVSEDEEEQGAPDDSDDASPPIDEDDAEGSSLGDGFLGFGGGEPGVGGGSGGPGEGSGEGSGDGQGGGLNGGNPSQCSAGDDQPSSFPFDGGAPGDSSPVPTGPESPWFEANAPGSDASLGAISLASLSVGNPIHVATGNKFQTEVDVPALPGRLGIGFKRHYNSSAVNDRSPIGAGWRHSYQATLRKREHEIEIVQADGRLLVFAARKDVPGSFVAQRASDGEVVARTDDFEWRWRSGRVLTFDAHGRLLSIRDRGGTLRLSYSESGELIAVTDPQNRVLRLEYYSNGRLAKLRGPGNIGAAYRYDDRGNLVQAVTADGSARRYAYENHRYPHHLSTISAGSVRPPSYGQRATFERIATWAYDERGRAVYSSHPGDAGKVTLAFERHFTEVTDAFGRKTRYSIEWRDGVAFVTQVSGPGCGACGQADAKYEYDDRFLPRSVSTKNALTMHYIHDEAGRVRQVDQDRNGARAWMTRYTYDSNGRLSRIERPSVKPDGITSIALAYASNGVLERIDERGFEPATDGYREIARSMHVLFDERQRMRRIDGPRTDVQDWTDIEYDDLDRIIAIKTAAGKKTILAHDAAGRPTRIAQTGRPDMKLTYDLRGRVTSIAQLRSKGELTVSYSYDYAGRLAAIVDPRGRRTRYDFDAAGRPNRMTRSDSEVVTVARYAPDDNIERIAAFDTSGQLLRALYYAYDSERRLVEIRDGDGQPLRQLAHEDHDALPDKRIDPLGHETALSYDVFGQLASVLAPDGGLTRIERDSAGRTTMLNVPNGAATSFAYDDFGRRVIERSADRGETKYTYDAAGNLIEKVDARGARTRLTYDAANRLIEVVRPEGNSRLFYVNGFLMRVDGEVADDEYEYDRDGRIVVHRRTIEDESFTTRFTYDLHGRITTRQLPSGLRLRYRYAANGELISIRHERWYGDRVIVQASESTSNEPRTLAALGDFSSGNGIETRTSFDARSANLSRRTIERVAQLEYAYDDAGQIKQIERDGKTRAGYEYDSAGRLVGARTPLGNFAYAYDANGNRVGRVLSPMDGKNRTGSPTPVQQERPLVRVVHQRDSHLPQKQAAQVTAAQAVKARSATQRYSYAPNSNRLLGIGDAISYRYDAAGNPLAIGSKRYEYDTSGRVTKLYEGNDLIAEYRYNFWGERVQKIVYASGKRSVTSYLYEQQKLIAEVDERGDVVREYVYLDHHPIALLEGSEIKWIHADHLGTPFAVTDEQKRTIWKADHRPFGEAIVDSDPDADGEAFTLNLRFPGQYADAESGTHYNYFRDYDPKTGRYLTADPIGMGGGPNAFAYVGSNPLRSIDSLGLYDEMVHYYMTYFLALVAGLPQDVARTMAIATQYVDENELTEPIHGLVSPNERALPLYHFVMDYDERSYGDNNDNRYLRFQSPGSDQLDNLIASTDLSRLRDLWVRAHPSPFPNTCPLPSFTDINNARYQLFGEYLHAYEDTFSHRDAYNMSYAVDNNTLNTPAALRGHGGFNVPDLFGHAPDHTYNQNFRSPSRCTIGIGRGATAIYNLSRTECDAQGGRNYAPANDDDTTECEVFYALGGSPIIRGTTEYECAALGRAPGAVGSTFWPGSGDIWAFNELRTLRMEYEVFTSIQRNFGAEIERHQVNGGRPFSWADLAGLPDWDRSNPWRNSRIGLEQEFEEWAVQSGHQRSGTGRLYNPSVVLQQFNASRASEADRLAILNAWLIDQNILAPDGRPVQIEEWPSVAASGGARRRSNIGWIPSGSFRGVLLPADSQCRGRDCPR